MKKKLLLLTVIVGGALALASSASAWEYIGSTGCQLHGYNLQVPVGYFNGAGAEAKITCPTNHWIVVQACLQQLVTGGWQTVVYQGHTYCAFNPADGGTFPATEDDVSVGYVPMTCNRYYRDRSWGKADGQQDTYAIGGWKVSSGCL